MLGELRALSSCTANVLVPFGDDKLVDKAFPTHGPVYQDLAKFLPGLAGESRSFDANSQYFKVLGTGGAETLNIGNGLFGTVAEPIVGNNPPPIRNRPPLKPDVAVRDAGAAGPALDPEGPAAVGQHRATRRRARASPRRRPPPSPSCATSCRRKGSDIKVLDRAITVDEIRQIAAKNGLVKQFERALKRLQK